jgi:hypothetical protein
MARAMMWLGGGLSSGAVPWGVQLGMQKLQDFIWGTTDTTDPQMGPVLDVLLGMVELVRRNGRSYDGNLELEEGESLVERAITGLRFDVLSFIKVSQSEGS